MKGEQGTEHRTLNFELPTLNGVKVFACLGSLTLLVGCSGPRNLSHGIPNFAIADDSGSPSTNHCCGWVYRGGQPTHEGWQYLKNLGVKYVVKLNAESEGSDAEAENLGMTVWRFPLPPKNVGQLFEEPCLRDVMNAVTKIESGSFTKVFVHCTHGQDRTGLAIGAYHIWYQAKRWNKENAYADMLAHGFHPDLIGLKECWENLPYLPYSP